MTMVPMTGLKFSPNPFLAAEWPGAYLGMGLTAENVAEKYAISREEQDGFAFDSHRKAIRAIEAGVFDPEIVPIDVDIVDYGRDGKVNRNSFVFKRDEGPRADTTPEALAKLKPAFKEVAVEPLHHLRIKRLTGGAAALERLVGALDPDLPIRALKTMSDQMELPL